MARSYSLRAEYRVTGAAARLRMAAAGGHARGDVCETCRISIIYL
jgi:hypothetical protein